MSSSNPHVPPGEPTPSLHTPWRADFPDGSGPEYILSATGGPVLKVRWGCECCQRQSPLTPEEIAIRDAVVRAVNERSSLLAILKAAQHCIDPNLPHAEDIEAQIAAALSGERGIVPKGAR